MKSKVSGLQLGNCCMGEREIQDGSYKELTVLGSLRGENAEIMQLHIAGDAVLTNCEIDCMSVAGEAVCIDSHVNFVEVAGEVTFRGMTTCGGIHVLGQINNEDTTCHILKYGLARGKFLHFKKPRISGTIQIDTLENFFPLELTQKQACKNIINCGQLSSRELLTCEHFFNFNNFSAQTMQANFAYLCPSSKIQIENLQGSIVIVDLMFDKDWLKDVSYDVELKEIYRASSSCKMASIQHIEADEVVLDYVKSKSISTRRAVIGAHCEIEVVTYSESCTIHELAKVKECRKV